MLHFLFYLHSGGGLDNLTRTTGGAQDSRFVGGSQEVSLRLAAELGDAVRLELAGARRSPRTATAVDGRRRLGRARAPRRAVVAVPPAVIPRISFDPPLSGRRAHLHAKMPPGYVIKCMARYERPFWRDEGLSGQAASPERPLAITFDNSPRRRLLRRAARLPRGRPRPPRRRARARTSAATLVLGDLAAYFGPQAREPLEYVEQDWAGEEWIRGGYGAHLGPGVWTDYGSAPARARGPRPLGGLRDQRGLERLHGRRGPLRRAGRGGDRRGSRATWAAIA